MIDLKTPMMMAWAEQEQNKEKAMARIRSLKAANKPIQLYELLRQMGVDVISLTKKEISQFEAEVRKP